MAHILFAESDDVAIKAFTGIINRSPHTITHVRGTEEAWEALTGGTFYHLLVTEVKLMGGPAKSLIRRIKDNPFTNKMPVLIYTRVTDRETVRQLLLLDIQNYLIKPYEDEKLFAEINKASVLGWWTRYFEDSERICQRRGLEREKIEQEYTDLLWQTRRFTREFKKTSYEDLEKYQVDRIQQLGAQAGELGYPAMEKVFQEILLDLEKRRWKSISQAVDDIYFGTLLLEERLKPGTHTVASQEDIADKKTESKAIRSVERVSSWNEIKEKLENIEGYPVIDSVAASFQMAAREEDLDVSVLVRMIQIDPCLTTQVLFYSNVISKHTKSAVADPQQAISLLGLARMRKLAGVIITVPDEHFSFRGFDWRKYWMFQVATAMLSEEMVKHMSLDLDRSMAFYCGLLHEMGKLLLCYFYPEGYENAIEYAYDTGVPLIETEKHYFGCNNEQVGEFFARRALMPEPIIASTAYQRDPENAPDGTAEYVAIVSLADYLCKRFEVGFSGSRALSGVGSLAQHPAWKVLKPSLYSGFTIARFEQNMKNRIKVLKRELIGLAEQHHLARET